MCKVISIVNHKGGVAKTTTTINLGAGLAKKGKKVLLLDCDPQAHTSMGTLGSEYVMKDYTFLESAMDYCIKDEDGKARLVPVRFLDGVDIIPSTLELGGTEMLMGNAKARENILDGLLGKLKEQYDFVLIDCPPSLNLLTQNAMMASDYLLVPVEGEFFAMKGIEKLEYLLALLTKKLHCHARILGYFMTKFNERKNLNRDIRECLIRDRGEENVFKTCIRVNVALGEMETQSQDIFTYAPESNGAQDYMSLTEEILEKTNI